MKASEYDVDGIVESADWTHDYSRSPYKNFKALVEATPSGIPRSVWVEVAFKHISGYGPEYAPRALDMMEGEGVEL